jgi:hypothetical protein
MSRVSVFNRQHHGRGIADKRKRMLEDCALPAASQLKRTSQNLIQESETQQMLASEQKQKSDCDPKGNQDSLCTPHRFLIDWQWGFVIDVPGGLALLLIISRHHRRRYG